MSDAMLCLATNRSKQPGNPCQGFPRPSFAVLLSASYVRSCRNERLTYVLQVLRTRLGLSSNEPDRLSLYKEARDLITASLPGTSYPDRELQWLVTTCWNKGAHQGKFMRLESAGQYMRLAMELLKHCHSLSNWQQVMLLHVTT